MDIMAPSPISAQATLAAQAPVREPPSVSTVDPSPAAENARMDANTANGEGGGDTAADARQRLAHRERVEDPKTPTGPPPTFQVTLLEVEQDLQNILARLEVARSLDRDAEAVRPDVPPRAEAKLAPETAGQSGAPTTGLSAEMQASATEQTARVALESPPAPDNSATATPTSQQVGAQPQATPSNDGMPV